MSNIAKRHKRTGQQRCDDLSHLAGQLRLVGAGGTLRQAEAPQTLKKFQSFVKSLDGAIRHAQRQRDEEERATV